MWCFVSMAWIAPRAESDARTMPVFGMEVRLLRPGESGRSTILCNEGFGCAELLDDGERKSTVQIEAFVSRRSVMFQSAAATAKTSSSSSVMPLMPFAFGKGDRRVVLLEVLGSR